MRELIDEARILRVCRSRIADLGQRLPETNESVVSLINAAVEAGDSAAFTNLTLAALATGRTIDASILGRGLTLVSDPLSLTIIVGHLSGDPVEVIVNTVQSKNLGLGLASHGLMLAAMSCRLRAAPVTTGIVTEARLLGRRARSFDDLLVIACIAREADDDGLWEILGGDRNGSITKVAEETRDHLSTLMTAPVLDSLPEEPPPVVHSGFTVRRAVPRVGRNEPCPCGSGQKYKKCCHAKDQEKLSKPTDIAGVNQDELRDDPAKHLNQDRMLAMTRHELLRLDPNALSVDLVKLLINLLLSLKEFGAVLMVFEERRWHPELADHHIDAVEEAAMTGEAELVRKLVALCPPEAVEKADFSFGVRLAIAAAEPGPMLTAIEENALGVLRNAQQTPVDLAYALMDFGCPALGVLVARGVIPIADLFDADVLLDSLLRTRDRLNLPPSDAIEEVLDTLIAESEDWQESHGLRKSLTAKKKELNEQDVEVSRLRARLARLEHEIEAKAASPAAAEPDSTVDDPEPIREADPEVAELRSRLTVVKANLKQRHVERNQLRRAVEEMRAEIEQLRKAGKAHEGHPNAEAADLEQALLLPADEVQSHPIRLARFAPKFRSDLDSSPSRIARSSVRLVGGLCAGDPQAFSDACRLKLDRTLWRVRVGRSHRMLFRLGGDKVEVLALVPRADLKHTIASLI